MERNLFKYIWRGSQREQIQLLAMVLLSLPFYFLSLDLPKTIVNGPIQGEGFSDPGATVLFARITNPWSGGILTEGVELDRTALLLALSLMFLALVCVNGLFKFQINTFKGRLGERMLRRLRYELVDRVLRFPLAQFRKVKSPEIATMVKDEVEPLGGFIGDAFVQPVFLGGQAATALIFIMVQDVWLGAIAAGIVGVQVVIIPRLRLLLLELGRRRQLASRALAGRIGEIADGAVEIHAHDTSNYERADVTSRLGHIFSIRLRIYQRKFFVKFVNNFLAQMTPFLFYLVGGWLAIRGRIDIGQLVAVIAAYKDLPGPIKELIDWDQRRLDVQIKYQQVVEQFQPEDMLPPERQDPAGADVGDLSGSLSVSSLSLSNDTGAKLLENVSLQLEPDRQVVITGGGGDGQDSLGLVLAGLMPASAGSVRIGERDIATLPEAVIGRQMSYVGQDAHLNAQSVREVLIYGLKHRPVAPAVRDAAAEKVRREEEHESRLSCNAPFDPEAQWIDFDAADTTSDGLDARLREILVQVELERDIYQLGLSGRIDPAVRPDLAERLLVARQRFRASLAGSPLESVVALMQPDAYNRQATVAENILFGTPLDEVFAQNALADNPYVMEILKQTGLHGELLTMGRAIASTMVELFADLPPDHPFFEQAGLIAADDLPVYQGLVQRIGAGGESEPALSDADRRLLMVLPFGYMESRHKLGLVDEAMEERILQARRQFADNLPESLAGSVAFYDPDHYNPAASVRDNILMGRAVHTQARAAERLDEALDAVLEELDLQDAVFTAGLDYNIGPGGRRLVAAQRQKLAMARAVLKRPRIMIINGALDVLDRAARDRIAAAVRAGRAGDPERCGMIWIGEAESALVADFVVVMAGGRVAAQGTPAEVNVPDSPFHQLLTSAAHGGSS